MEKSACAGLERDDDALVVTFLAPFVDLFVDPFVDLFVDRFLDPFLGSCLGACLGACMTTSVVSCLRDCSIVAASPTPISFFVWHSLKATLVSSSSLTSYFVLLTLCLFLAVGGVSSTMAYTTSSSTLVCAPSSSTLVYGTSSSTLVCATCVEHWSRPRLLLRVVRGGRVFAGEDGTSVWSGTPGGDGVGDTAALAGWPVVSLLAIDRVIILVGVCCPTLIVPVLSLHIHTHNHPE